MSNVLRPSGFRRFLHWLTALLMMGMLALGFYMTWFIDTSPEGIEATLFRFSLHKSIGVVILVLVLWRLYVMLTGRSLKTANHHPMEVMAAISVQTYFLCAMIAMPLTGLIQHYYASGAAPIWILPGGGFHAAESNAHYVDRLGVIHWLLAWTTLAALLAHIGGALKHHWLDGDSTLSRMVSGRDRGQLTHDNEHAPAIWSGLGRLFGLAGFAAILTTGFLLPAEQHDHAQDQATTLTSNAGNWSMIAEESILRIQADQQGSAFEAVFERFSADITLDPDDQENASIIVEIDSASFASGLPDRDATVRNNDWMDVAAFPLAYWRSTAVTLMEDGRYQADGILDIRGVTLDVPLLFTLSIEGDRAHAIGEASFDRFAIQLGRGDSNGTSMAKPLIGVTFDIHATRAE